MFIIDAGWWQRLGVQHLRWNRAIGPGTSLSYPGITLGILMVAVGSRDYLIDNW